MDGEQKDALPHSNRPDRLLSARDRCRRAVTPRQRHFRENLPMPIVLALLAILFVPLAGAWIIQGNQFFLYNVIDVQHPGVDCFQRPAPCSRVERQSTMRAAEALGMAAALPQLEWPVAPGAGRGAG
jgi:hypothetical protein